MPNDQLDLFDQRAAVAWFPIERRRQVVRGAARRLLTIDVPADRISPWERECAKLAAEMRAAGLESSSIDAELRRFFDVVDEEMHRLAGHASDSSGGSTAWRE